jgi:hypothetical protein
MIMAWFITGLRNEAIRLAKRYKRLQEHELLTLNDLISQDAENEVTEMLDTIAATYDVLLEVEDLVFLQEAAKNHYGNSPGRTTRERGSYKIWSVTTGGASDERAGVKQVEKTFCLGQAHRQVELYPGQAIVLRPMTGSRLFYFTLS